MRLLQVEAVDAPNGSRVAGRGPAGVDLTCPVCAGPAGFVLTLGPDVLGPTVGEQALSLLACASLECRFAGPHGGCSVLVVAHDDAPRADGPEPDGFAGRALVAAEEEDDPDPNSDQSKVGGTAGYLQSWGWEAGPELEAEGLAFLAQWSEVSYRSDMGGGEYPFLFGTAYLFARRTADGRADLGTARGFWQNA